MRRARVPEAADVLKLVLELVLVLVLGLPFFAGRLARGADYSKRALALDGGLKTRLLGKWTNSVDHLIVEIENVDLKSGRITGKEWPSSGPSSEIHELIGWINAAPPKEGFDNVIPITFSTTLYEYGTLPSWAGYLRGDTIVTMHYLVWPNRAYPWDHISTFQETWTRVP